ncbi:MAG: hypothetical protein HF311_14500 [Ignavibacteria bacterium]|nr:hypothetical protein [Ignavibacteria bacterium]
MDGYAGGQNAENGHLMNNKTGQTGKIRKKIKKDIMGQKNTNKTFGKKSFFS